MIIKKKKKKGWEFWIDRGGTFTDIVAKRPDGTTLTRKLLSDKTELYRDAGVEGIRRILGISEGHAIPAGSIDVIKMGTTVGTNALLQRNGEPTVLVITRGFRDCLRIGYQNRPDIFALRIERPEMLYSKVIEVDGRHSGTGEELEPLDIQSFSAALEQVYNSGIHSVAVVLMHAWISPQHELRIGKLAKTIGFTQISLSHQVSPLMKIVSRGDTTVADAYLSPVLRHYVDQFGSSLSGNPGTSQTSLRLMFMQSNGGLTSAVQFQGKDCILSGPAGGIVGAVAVSRQAGFDRIVTFDMGGTSTDVAHYAGKMERSFDTEVAGIRIKTPMMNIHTVAAGGGSILAIDGLRFQVGPDSAGANPGPCCYRNGGPLCVTDANLMVGKLSIEHFPKVFGPEGNLPPDLHAVQAAFEKLSDQLYQTTGRRKTPEQIAEGFLAVAVGNMANAIKRISVERGYDLSGYTLCCFGAAGGQHVCQVADELGIRKILIHRYAGVLSAYGMGLADIRALREQAVETSLNEEHLSRLGRLFNRLERECMQEMLRQTTAEDQLTVLRRLHLRFSGTDTALMVDHGPLDEVVRTFHQAHQKRFGFRGPSTSLVIEAVSVETIASQPPNNKTKPPKIEEKPAEPLETLRFFSGQSFHDAHVYLREGMQPGNTIDGPAIVIEPNATTVIEPKWAGRVDSDDQLVLSRQTPRVQKSTIGIEADPIMLEVFNKRFMAIAEQMGHTLQNTALSVNIKERLDFSCAIFDTDANLIANAPHIPVHLGSMGESVRILISELTNKFSAGDVYMLNSPFHGGTHLPDITVVTPVFDPSGSTLLFFVASRGHHADIGGSSPGSMPPDSRTIDQEGIWTAGLKLVENGTFLEKQLSDWLSKSLLPARNPAQNMADLKAQIAANEKGSKELLDLVNQYDAKIVHAYMGHIQDNAEEAVRQAIRKSKSGNYLLKMDNGAQIAVEISVDRQDGNARIDFTGTSQQQSNNFNAPSAVVKAAVLYVFRTLVDDDIPLNAGCLRPLQIIIPEASMLNPQPPAAVVAGNVETSQCIVDALYGALGVLAGSQGTMNNLTFGNRDYQYYETICGGSGAGPDFDGTDAVQTHMTNSRITDPEVLESRYPVHLERFEINPGSGGEGKHRGGNGVIREMRFEQQMTAAILSGFRSRQPAGMDGGKPGKQGASRVERADGSVEQMEACFRTEVYPGDRIIVETPGGGGFGRKD